VERLLYGHKEHSRIERGRLIGFIDTIMTSIDGRRLGAWVSQQRIRRGSMSQERKDKFEELNL
jgi:hypothetical protein